MGPLIGGFVASAGLKGVFAGCALILESAPWPLEGIYLQDPTVTNLLKREITLKDRQQLNLGRIDRLFAEWP